MKERHKNTNSGRNSIMFNIIKVIVFSIAFIVCTVHEKDIDAFFGYNPHNDITANSATYEEASFRRSPGSSFTLPEHSDASVIGSATVSSSDPTPEPESTPESSPELTLDASSTPTLESTFEPTSHPIPTTTPPQTPEPEPIPEPIPTLDLFSCLGEYEDDNGNSIILQLDTQFHEMKYALQFYYNRGFARILGDDGYRTGSDYSNILFTVKYDDEDYPFTIQVGDGCINVSNGNKFGPFDGHEFAGTYQMTKQYTVPGWISGT